MVAGVVDACVVWEPNKSQLLSKVKGTHDIFDSRSTPGLIPDLLVFQTKVVRSRHQDVQNIVDSWYDMLGWWRAHPDQAASIMAARTNSPVSFYKGFIHGTRVFDAKEAAGAFSNTPKLTSLYTSGNAICGFLTHVRPPQIDRVPNYAAALDPTFVNAALAKGEGKQPPLKYSTSAD
jgi:NitT/TauT family transport system substrate-binding protein